MANSTIAVSQGSGKNLATYSVSEDAATKEIQRASLNNSSGSEIGTSGSPLRIDPTGTTTQPVSVSGVSTADNQTNGSQKTQIVDGSGNVIGSTSNALDVNIKSGAASGTQYTEGDTDATITGTAILFESNTGTNALSAVSNSTPLPISDAGGAITVDGTVSAAQSGTWNVTNISGTVSLPTGASTSANQSTIIGHLDGVEGLLTTIDADTGNLPTIETNTDFGTVTGGGTETGALRVTIANNSTGVLSVDDNSGSLTVDGTVTANLSATDNAVLDSIQTAVETIDNAISGSEMQVDVVGALPAGTNLIGRVSASSETSTIYDGTTALTPKFAIIDAATSGDNTLVAAVTSKKIRVHALFVVSAGTVTARFESGAGGTALTGQMNLVANTGFVLPYNPVGWFETASNTLLNLELSGAISCDGSLVYTEV